MDGDWSYSTLFYEAILTGTVGGDKMNTAGFSSVGASSDG
jgi:hypothetical protein